VATPTTPGNTASLAGVSASSTTDAWAIGRTQVNREDFAPLALHWNGTSWVTVPSADAATGASVLTGVATTPGAAIVQAAGLSGSSGAENPLAEQHG
jgi:tripartite-type tricarboxylate transporter receptor subunit TctC